jgi:phosphoribosylanthranilate isomerase
MRTRVKICGFTRPDDAKLAAALGVDAIGLVFYPPSPRNVDITQARAIVSSLPAFVTCVALFVDAEEQEIRQVLQHVPIDLIQFHGIESPQACRIYGKPYIKAVSMQAGVNIPALADQYDDAAGLLLDAYHPGLKGGTGSQFDWAMVPKATCLPIILAGGLTPENVRLAMQSVRPFAIDVSSGVEREKGVKDADKMAAVLKKVAEGDRN